MVSIIFRQPDGENRPIGATEGRSLMQAAIDHDVAGILALCGGSAACGTCHIYVGEPFAESLPPPSELEDQMLDSTAAPRLPNSRLSCQVTVTPDMDGWQIICPPIQD
jgi:2Fe-2S ferredoxin